VRGTAPVSAEHRDFARALRHHMTRAEEILWARLRGSRFHGAKFKRQVPFDRYVADFYCHAAKLVVEIDGKQHEWFADYDVGRTQILEAYGVRVIRFTNAEVCEELDSVLARIEAELRLPSG
jgi:very-short-patch-repair endonuclease